MRVAIGGISHETNTFSNVKTTIEYFKNLEWEHGQEILDNHTGVRDFLGGMIAEGMRQGVELVPTFSTRANPSGLIPRETLDEILDNLLSSIRQAGPVDGICLALHGGGIAEGADDLEGTILTKVREVVGYEIPIVVTLDLHANLTDTMLKEANALFGVNFYPHVDCYERGEEAMANLLKIIKGECKPVMRLKKLPMMLSSSTTDLSPAKDINEICWEWEKQPSVIDCTFFHGFSQTDLPDMRVGVLTITDNDPELAERICEDVTAKIWERRHEFYIEHPGPSEGLELALQEEGGPIVINETSDNPGAGTPGDGTHLLRAMIEMNIPNSCFGFICDPETVEAAHQSGVGTYIDVRLGGKTDKLHGEPIEARAYVKTLSDGQFVQTSVMNRGRKVNLGKAARLQIGNVDVIVSSRKSQTMDEQVFLLHGIDVTMYKIVALKSENHFRAAFTPLAKKIITVDSPGLSSFNLKYYNYTRVQRPVMPLDEL